MNIFNVDDLSLHKTSIKFIFFAVKVIKKESFVIFNSLFMS